MITRILATFASENTNSYRSNKTKLSFMIPRFEEIRIQALKELSAGVVMRAKDLRIPLAKHFGLTEEEINVWYLSGNGEIFLDRISWALSYLLQDLWKSLKEVITKSAKRACLCFLHVRRSKLMSSSM